jgi:DNA-directed RNA polymerase omega subunit
MADDVLETEEPAQPLPKAAPIESRFLFVDVAAARAKQLRRGALPRLEADGVEPREIPHKLERVAMKEVTRGLIDYNLPESKPAE